MWIEYPLYLFEFHSISTASRDNRNVESTGGYWLIKVFAVLEGIQSDVMLDGNIYFDEMFFPVIKHEAQIVNSEIPRHITQQRMITMIICILLQRERQSHPERQHGICSEDTLPQDPS